MPNILNSPVGRNRKPVSVIFFILLAVVIITCGCTNAESSKDTPGLGSSGIPSPDITPVNIPVNDTVTGVNNSPISEKVYGYEAELQKIPEVSTGVMNPGEVARYKEILTKLNTKDPGAARWAVSMGLFAEDRKISDDEIAFVDAVVKKDDPLRILVTPWVRGGINSQGANWATAASYPTGEYGYLTDDLQTIESARGAVDPATREKLMSIIKASAGDYELRKGLAIIDEYGVPGKNVFN